MNKRSRLIPIFVDQLWLPLELVLIIQDYLNAWIDSIHSTISDKFPLSPIMDKIEVTTNSITHTRLRFAMWRNIDDFHFFNLEYTYLRRTRFVFHTGQDFRNLQHTFAHSYIENPKDHIATTIIDGVVTKRRMQ